MTGRLLAPDAHALALDPEPVPAGDVVAGSPWTATRPLGELGDVEVGVWEISEGTVRDVEADEIFVVLSGEGSVAFEDGSRIPLGPGTVVRLHAGERTVWEITRRLRKVYVA